MANEWPSDLDENWDDAISANLTNGGSHNASTGLHGLGLLSAFKTITFTRDMTAASGDVAYTGVGFQPRQVVFFASVASTKIGSWGIDDGTTANATVQIGNGTTERTVDSSISLNTIIGTNQVAEISSLNSDGFTLTWAKTLSPTGTATIIALCLK